MKNVYCVRVLDREGREFKMFCFDSKEKALRNLKELFKTGVMRMSIISFRCKLNEKINKEDFKYF